MKKLLALLIVASSGFLYAEDIALNSFIPGKWKMVSSDMISFNEGKQVVSSDPLPADTTEVLFNKDFSGKIIIDGPAKPFKWAIDDNILKITIGESEFDFKVHVINKNQVLVIQTRASRPDVSVVAIAERKQ